TLSCRLVSGSCHHCPETSQVAKTCLRDRGLHFVAEPVPANCKKSSAEASPTRTRLVMSVSCVHSFDFARVNSHCSNSSAVARRERLAGILWEGASRHTSFTDRNVKRSSPLL